MFRVFTCLTLEHDWQLVALAGTVCLLASVVVVSLLHRARATAGRTRACWLALGAMAAGCGIWATHFIAMLAYEPGVATGYSVGPTVLSLIVASAVTGVGLSCALSGPAAWRGALGGAIVGAGIAVMHYTGMSALEVPGRVTWDSSLVTVSIALGIMLAAAAVVLAGRRHDAAGTLGAAVLLTLAIVSHHFVAMGAVEIIPDPTRIVDALSLSPSTLAVVIAGATTTMLGMSLVAAMSDRQSEDKLRQQKIRLDTALETMCQGLCMFDREGRIVLFNARYAGLMGLDPEFLRDSSLLDVFRKRKSTGDFLGDPEEFFAHVRAEMNAGTSHTRVMVTRDGRALRVVDQPMTGGGWLATFEDITEWRRAQEQIAHMARHDALTNLPNRMFFREELEQAVRRIRRHEQLAVLCLDLDHFKDVNDTLGHPIGDELLKEVALRLTRAVGEGDIVARLGGDEFAVLQVGSESQPSDSASLASRLVEAVEAPYEIAGHRLVIGLSVGVSIAPGDTEDVDQLLKNADMALYRAKADGRGIYRFFEPGMDARAQARRVLELELRTALARGEFEVHYQPIHDLQENRITCFEALVRWIHPLRGTIPPGNFISLAEETGLIVPLGEWVLHRACADAATWPADLRVAVNLSPVQFKHRGLISAVRSSLSQAGLAPERLELEITESVLLNDSESTLERLHALRAFGVRISMDDFGTGYSSLSYLRSFPFDKIKIDRSFIQELATRADCIAIVRAVAGLGQSLGISTTAEGVETDEQLALIRAEGCTEVQGYLFSKPRPAHEIAGLLAAEQASRAVA